MNVHDKNYKIALKVMTRRFKARLVASGSAYHLKFKGVDFQSSGFFPTKDPVRIQWFLKYGEWLPLRVKLVQECRSEGCINHYRKMTKREQLKLPIFVSEASAKKYTDKVKRSKFGTKHKQGSTAEKILAEYVGGMNKAELARSYSVTRQYVSKIIRDFEGKNIQTPEQKGEADETV